MTALSWGVAYSDAPSSQWDRIAGFVAWLVTGFVLLEPLSGFFIGDCFSEECNPSLRWRVLALFLSAFGLGAIGGWTATAFLKRVIHGRAS